MRQRLVLAKTLLTGPEILLLDEPASGLDPIARKQMRDLLIEARNGGASILISSHILSELSEFVDAVIILEKGSVILSGTINDINKAMGGGQRLIIRFTNESEGLPEYKRLLQEFGIGSDRVTHERSNYVIHFKETDGAAAVFLQKLIAAGVILAECSIKTDDIEDIFFKVGAREVA
jgi:ABC-2 type transport system ATP-binding protein